MYITSQLTQHVIHLSIGIILMRNWEILNQKKPKSNQELDSIILETIDDVLSLLGESPKKEIYFHLWKDFRINREEIPDNLANFSDALGKLLGEGAKLLEINFMKKLQTKIKTVQEWSEPDWIVPELTFESFVKLKRQNIQKAREICKMGILFADTEQKNVYP